MIQAVKSVLEAKMSIREAANCYKVPKSTLQRKVSKVKSGKVIKMEPELGRFQSTFDENHESEWVTHMKDMD